MANHLLNQAQRDRNLSDDELAYSARRSVRTLRNLKCGNSDSLALRQRLTNILRAKIWPGVEVTDRIWVFKPGTDLELSPASSARAWTRMFNDVQPGVAVRDGNVVHFTMPIAVTFEIQPSVSSSIRRTAQLRND